MKKCILHPDKECTECGECDDRCQLNPQKVCDNCFQCLDMFETMEYARIGIRDVVLDETENHFADEDLHPANRQANLLITGLQGCKGRRGRK